MGKLSAFIIAKNEAQRITKAINSLLTIADEIIVVDSGSTDDTDKISQTLGARVIFNPWQGYVQQKAFGENACKYDWVINIDADEELSKELQDEISLIFATNNENHYHAYSFDLVIMHPRDNKTRFLAPSNNCIRLYNKNFCSFGNVKNVTTHDSIKFNENIDYANKIYKLNSIALHRSALSISHLVEKANFYSSEQAKDMYHSKRHISKLRISLEMFYSLFKTFFIRRYFVFGFDGFIYCVIFAFARFMRLAKLYEMQHSKDIPNTNQD